MTSIDRRPLALAAAEAEQLARGHIAEIASEILGGPRDPGGLTADELEQVFEEIGTRADQQEAELEAARKRYEDWMRTRKKTCGNTELECTQ